MGETKETEKVHTSSSSSKRRKKNARSECGEWSVDDVNL